MNSTRREFLRRIAAGAAFVAPAIHTLAAPAGLSAGGGGGGGMTTDPMSGKGNDAALTISPTTSNLESTPSTGQQAPGGKAPWEVAPPGSGGGGEDDRD